jgi:hypothetical protein
VIPVLGDYLEEAGVARHNTNKVAQDLMQLAAQEPRSKGESPVTSGS